MPRGTAGGEVSGPVGFLRRGNRRAAERSGRRAGV